VESNFTSALLPPASSCTWHFKRGVEGIVGGSQGESIPTFPIFSKGWRTEMNPGNDTMIHTE
jgi:hypothetical protein